MNTEDEMSTPKAKQEERTADAVRQAVMAERQRCIDILEALLNDDDLCTSSLCLVQQALDRVRA